MSNQENKQDNNSSLDIGGSIKEVSPQPVQEVAPQQNAQNPVAPPNWEQTQQNAQTPVATPNWEQTQQNAQNPVAPPNWEQTQQNAQNPVAPPNWEQTQQNAQTTVAPPNWEQTQQNAQTPVAPPNWEQTQQNAQTPVAPPNWEQTQQNTQNPVAPPNWEQTQQNAQTPVAPPNWEQTQQNNQQPMPMQYPMGKVKPRKEKSDMSPWVNMLIYFLGYNTLYPIIITLITIVVMVLNGANETATNKIVYDIIMLGIIEVILIFALVFSSKKLLKNDLQKCKPVWKFLGLTILASIGTLIINMAVGMMVSIFSGPVTNSNEEGNVEMLLSNPVYGIFMVAIFAPIVEELVFRAGMYRAVERKLGGIWAIIISSTAFASIHMFANVVSGEFEGLINVVIYLAIGLVIGALYYLTDNIYFVIAVHFMNNLFSLSMTYLAEYLEV